MISKLIKTLSFVIALSAISIHAETTNVESNKQTVQPVAKEKVDYKDALLKFVIDKADKYSGAAEDTIRKAVDIIIEETPEFVNEYIRWHFWKNIAWMATSIFLIFLCPSVLYGLVKKNWFNFEKLNIVDKEVITGVLTALSVVLGLIFLGIFLTCLFDLIQIIVAPRIYIIEQVLNVIKK